MAHPASCAFVAMDGEIVELFERAGRRFARIVLTPQMVCEVAAEGFADAHLGDHVVVEGRVTIDQVSVVPSGDAV